MVIQSNVLKMILGQNIPFVYPNFEWTELHQKNLGRHNCHKCIFPFKKFHQPCFQKFLVQAFPKAHSASFNMYGCQKV